MGYGDVWIWLYGRDFGFRVERPVARRPTNVGNKGPNISACMNRRLGEVGSKASIVGNEAPAMGPSHQRRARRAFGGF